MNGWMNDGGKSPFDDGLYIPFIFIYHCSWVSYAVDHSRQSVHDPPMDSDGIN